MVGCEVQHNNMKPRALLRQTYPHREEHLMDVEAGGSNIFQRSVSETCDVYSVTVCGSQPNRMDKYATNAP